MGTPKILLFGANGQVGSELRQKLAPLGDVIAKGRADADFTKPESLRVIVRELVPQIIVNAAAYTAVDKAETEPELAIAVNGAAPRVLAEEAIRLGSLLVHYSTDYVFDGTKAEPYVETDSPNPLNAYGRSKLAGDEAIQTVGEDYLIFRTSWVYGARGNNFFRTMLRLADRPELRIVDDQVGAPTSSECIAQATADAVQRILPMPRQERARLRGIYNLTCTGETSWFGFAKAIFSQHAKLPGSSVPKLLPISTAQYGAPAPRPSNSRLSINKLQQTFGVRLPDWTEALSRVVESLSETSRS